MVRCSPQVLDACADSDSAQDGSVTAGAASADSLAAVSKGFFPELLWYAANLKAGRAAGTPQIAILWGHDMPLDVGDSVRVKSSGALGELLQIRVASSAYVVKLKDGTLLKNVPFNDVEKYSAAATPAKQAIVLAPDAFAVGTKVDAKYKGKTFYPGTIARAHADDRYDIDYDDGEKETKVPRDYLRIVAASTAKPTASPPAKQAAKKAATSGDELDVGTKVEARYKGKTAYCPGTITKVNNDESFDITYDNGEKESGVDRDLIRSTDAPPAKKPSKTPSSPSKQSGLKVGTKVEARYKGKSKYYPGKIAKCHADETYDIDYDDGEKEKRIERDLIRVVVTSSTKTSQHNTETDLVVGTKVEAKYKGKTYYPGTIAKVNDDESYDIDYDDGEKEKRVDRDYIRIVAAPAKPAPKKSEKKSVWEAGMSVDARYKGKSKYYPGKITKVHSDGTVDIDYDDGEKEKRIDTDLVRARGSPTKPATTQLDVGTKVEAKYKGKTYYPGKIARETRGSRLRSSQWQP
ncbi:hypothetical protein SDRG_12199 [Saprolegnia diclina VS20]|uniref:Tudor domain-containing protein n=1 Tax=Saprolegnia diclina (strain VS20) TaxID=1156394 RepID=T0Q6A6_SAPDV|nr:hypothetical protein SDRG_12199 [Saprolegnia diclina VS20]EQC30141.1 hypothetical protein SDRG_12199 [Saprolegnia diclina VS20]|eukprot:XP_008616484.1 hypothetical protein SDRG_12199 [Saprolegnia diclina VS20]